MVFLVLAAMVVIVSIEDERQQNDSETTAKHRKTIQTRHPPERR